MKTIGIAGGSGFVGRHLAATLIKQGYRVIIFSRGKAEQKGKIQFASWYPDHQKIDTTALSTVDAMVNLAGAGVMEHRWTTAYKQEIISSRVAATYFLLSQLKAFAPHCTTFIGTSATGIYGPDRTGFFPFKEDATPYADFLGEVCQQWEAASKTAAANYRTTIFRLGIVLGKDGGAYPQFADPMKFGVMPLLGGGRQIVSWIHIEDVVSLMLQALEREQFHGIYNAVSPQPVAHKTLMKAIARAKGGLKLPVPVPALALKLMLGASSIEILKSCTVSVKKVLKTGFTFKYTSIEDAAADLASA